MTKALTSAQVTGLIGVKTPTGTVEVTINSAAEPGDLGDALRSAEFLKALQEWLEEFVDEYPRHYAELQAKIEQARLEGETVAATEQAWQTIKNFQEEERIARDSALDEDDVVPTYRDEESPNGDKEDVNEMYRAWEELEELRRSTHPPAPNKQEAVEVQRIQAISNKKDDDS